MRVIAIVGPTAVGKTSLSIKLAKELNGEIISCDSMQIYKGMDIGTAKPTTEEREGIFHHLIDILKPNEQFSCADYAALAKEKIEEITKRGKTPIFCGGTGLYLDSVLKISSFNESQKDEEYREFLTKKAENEGNEAVYKMLLEIDPESAEKTHPNNVQRVIRALEIYKCTGITKTEWDKKSREETPPYESTVIFLSSSDREKLYERIDTRVDQMMAEGLLDETIRLYENGYLKEGTTAYSAIGYKELLPFVKREKPIDECVEDLKLATRHYAKRQLTWFSSHKDYYKINVDIDDPYETAINIINGKMNTRQEKIKEGYKKVAERIKELSGERNVTLLAATKMQGVEDINYLISLGVNTIGENRVNELMEKYDGYDKGASLHFIGTLQKNKVKYIIDKVDLIHSVDSISLLQEIDKRAGKIGKRVGILIEVNSGREENKGGIMPEDVIDFYNEAIKMENVEVMGLMTMAPKCENKEDYLNYFGLTKELFDKLFKNKPDAILSMGMSDSYEYAIMAGANLVRVGSKIFGERKY